MKFTEEEYIEKAASVIVEQDLGTAASFFLEALQPVFFISGELAVFFLAPVLGILENVGYDFIDTFQKRENIDRLVKRVNELSKEKEKLTKINSTSKPSLFSKIESKIKNFFK